MEDLGNNSAEQLKGFVERIEDLEAEKAETSEKIKSEYAAAAGVGFDKKALRQILKDRKADMQATAEFRAIVETYRKALGQFADTELGEWAASFAAAQNTVRASRPASPASSTTDDDDRPQPKGKGRKDLN